MSYSNPMHHGDEPRKTPIWPFPPAPLSYPLAPPIEKPVRQPPAPHESLPDAPF